MNKPDAKPMNSYLSSLQYSSNVLFIMIAGINKLKTLTKHISCECRSYNSDQWLNNDKCRCECKKRHVCEKHYVWNSATCNFSN